jgi:DNA polymerase III psi subunit
MRQENVRSHYLKMMGITEWRLRESQPLPYGYYYELMSDLSQKNYLLADFDPQNAEQEHILLSNILKALKMQIHGGDVALADLALQFNADARIILLGNKVTDFVVKNYLDGPLKKGIQQISQHCVLVTYSLAELIVTPNLKAEVWRDLKNIFN